MKICLFSTSDIGHGAGIAAYRLLVSLRNCGHEVKMLTPDKLTDDKDVIKIEKTFLGKYFHKYFDRKNFTYLQGFISKFSHNSLIKHYKKWADVCNVHAIHHHKNYLPLSLLYGKNVYWTLHDMWPMTGHCIFPYGDCNKWKSQCINNCEFSSDYLSIDPKYIEQSFNKKKDFYDKINIKIICPSTWIYNNSKNSPLLQKFNSYIAFNSVDPRFKQKDKRLSKKNLQINSHKVCVTFGCGHLQDRRKGFLFFLKAIKQLNIDNIQIICFGDGYLPKDFCERFNIINLGKIININKLIDIYNASDIFIATPLIDNLPNMILESLSCGTPVIAFNTGGITDMIENEKNGFIVENRNIKSLAEKISILSENESLRYKMSNNSLKIVKKRFTQDIQAKRYLEIFNKDALQ